MSRPASPRLPYRAAPRYTAALLAGVALLTACSDTVTGPRTDELRGQPEERQPTITNPLLTTPGCLGASAGAHWDEIRSYSPLASFGNAKADASFWAEVAAQRGFWGSSVRADVYIIRDNPGSAANAMAFSSGWIGFGYNFYHQHVAQHGQLAIDGTLAHEWGHRAQYTFGWPLAAPLVELEADAFSGYYIALAKQRPWTEVQGYYQHWASLGDRNFNSDKHHGTSQQRTAAAYLGVQVGVQSMQRGQRFTYEQLHQFFAQQIAAQIMPYRGLQLADARYGTSVDGSVGDGPRVVPLGDIVEGRNNGAEVTYPRRTAEELRNLWPRETAGARLEPAR